MIIHRSDNATTETTSQEDWEDAVEPTTESEQASTASSTTENPLNRIYAWLDRNTDVILATGVIASLAGNAYAMVKNR